MSFAAGIGAGMGAGIGAGIAIGVASGRKTALDEVRNYVMAHELTIHDHMGKDVSVKTVLHEIAAETQHANKGWVVAVLILALLTGLAVLAIGVYFVLT